MKWLLAELRPREEGPPRLRPRACPTPSYAPLSSSQGGRGRYTPLYFFISIWVTRQNYSSKGNKLSYPLAYDEVAAASDTSGYISVLWNREGKILDICLISSPCGRMPGCSKQLLRSRNKLSGPECPVWGLSRGCGRRQPCSY